MTNLIAETAFTHEGDFNYLIKQIDEAEKGNSDFIKFQILINKEDYFVNNHPGNKSIDELTFTKKQWIEALKYAKSKKLKVLALPLTIGCIKFCEENKGLIDLYEVHSVTFNEIPFLSELSKTTKKIMLGVGGRALNEIDIAIKALNRKKEELIIMFGFQSFPTEKENLNLNKIKSLKNYYGCEIGYADHSQNDSDDFHFLNALAQSLGCTYFEKHIVDDKKSERIDSLTAISSSDFVEMRKQLDLNFKVLGDGDLLSLNEKELNYKQREKKIVAVREIQENTIITETHIGYKVTEEKSDFGQGAYITILGKRANKSIAQGDTINFKDILS